MKEVPFEMRCVALALVVAWLLMLSAGCAPKNKGAGEAASPAAPAVAHIDVHGAIRLTRDVPVKQCYIGRPGTRLLNGYSVTFGGDSVVEGGEILIPEYKGDGTYVESAAKREGISRVLSWVIVNVARSPGFPHGTTLEERPETRVIVTIKANGAAGRAEFKNYRSLYGQNGDERGGLTSGTIEWSCAEVKKSPTL